jgi:hypothetical protein
MTDDLMRQLLARQRDIIDRCGWAVVAVSPRAGDPELRFAYTVGLTEHRCPEFLIAGLPEATATGLLNNMGRRVFDRAERFSHGQAISDLIVGYVAVVVEGPAHADLVAGAASAHYGREQVRIQQIVWPDPAGRYPWDDGWAYSAELQPVIGCPSVIA